jgi:hypothetical protein
MKSKLFIGYILLGIMLLAGACSTAGSTSITSDNNVPPAPNKYLVSVSADDFNKKTMF